MIKVVAALAFVAVLVLLLLTIAPACKPGDKGVRVGNLLMGGCP